MRHVLFVCNHNAGRSQMAHAFFDRFAPDDVRAESAGTQPAKAVWPVVVEVMSEVGIDLSQATPTKLTTEMQLHADWAVTMGCGDACPFVPAVVQEWDIVDPSMLPIEWVREIRDEVEQHVKDLLVEHLNEIRTDRTAHQLRLERLLPAVRDELAAAYSDQQIRTCADRVLTDYDDAAVRGHVMVLAQRRVQDCLAAGGCS
ncbi:MAG: arsenate reductase ArsC [Solirubrobacteraceae bacterium]|nr:arsenate reductase ArsC [Solirubrobacteraceae bacterium]